MAAYKIVSASNAADLNTLVATEIAGGLKPGSQPRIEFDYTESGTLKTTAFYQEVSDTAVATGVTHYQVLQADDEAALKTLVDAAITNSWKLLGPVQTAVWFDMYGVPRYDTFFQPMYKGTLGAGGGEAGPEGPQGPAGPAGAQGPAGPAGADGADATVAGAEGEVQFNSSNALGASATFKFDGTGAKPVVYTPMPVVPNFYDDNGIKVNDTWNEGMPVYGWRDITGNIFTRTAGGTAPAFAAYQGNVYQYSMGTTGTKEVFNEFHMPHDYVALTPMFIHAHWSTADAPTGSVIWDFEVTYAKGFDQAAFHTPILVRVKQASTGAYKHMIAEVQLAAPYGELSLDKRYSNYLMASISSGSTTLLLADGGGIDESIIGRPIRIKGAGPAGADLDTTVTVMNSTVNLTVADAASTTITDVVDGAVFRVLDSNLLQVDGLILVRTSRNAGATGDDLDVAPFLHTVDLHYRSSNVGTAQKIPPFYDEYPS